MNEEKLKIAVFIDFDNIQIGVRSTLNRDFDLGLVLEALKERGEVVTKIAYGNWKRAGELTRTLTQNAVLMVQRDLTPRGDKNGADINLALDALEMAINHPHINAFVIVGGDSDFIALVEKLKQFNKAVFVVGGRSFTSSVLQRNCREFLAYDNLVEDRGPDRRRDEGRRRDIYPLTRAVPLIYRGLKVLADREVQAQLGLLKSTLVQLDSTFNERDYGSSSFRGFIQKCADAGLLLVKQQGNSYVVEPLEREPMVASEPSDSAPESSDAVEADSRPEATDNADAGPQDSVPRERDAAPRDFAPRPYVPPPSPVAIRPPEEALEMLDKVLAPLRGTNPRPLYLRNVKQMLRAESANFDEQQYGFASIVDLLRAGQSQNWLRLQRDRRGALRVFIVSTGGTGAAAPPSAPPTNSGAANSANGDEDDQIALLGAARHLPAPVVVPDKPESEDSQIAVLGYYDGIHGEQQDDQTLSLAAAVADRAGTRKKRTRKPKGDGPPPRRRKPKA